ncbi:MAG: FAD-binding and (Fe-S)-binding domain-containing protein [Bacteroidales bacterium]|jgi:D-lactate dehydrogenase
MISGKYKELYNRLKIHIPTERMFHDALNTLAYGTDASFYRLTPKLVIRANGEDEVKFILKNAYEMDIPVTFRGAGTSLSGQSISDSVLVIASHGWNKYEILDNGLKIKLEPGIRGYLANRYLAPYGRKIGPDPASLESAMIGGIASNNASGMCCGTAQNSYNTIADIRIIFSDGTILDTANEQSKNDFRTTHKNTITALEDISAYINADVTLKERIKRKYKIKNTTGYSINSFVDYTDGIEIIKHIIIGSEGTLAFISNITYNTVIDYKYKSTALAIFHNIKEACEAVQILKTQPVSAVELIDRAGIRSVDQTPGIPDYLKTLPQDSCALLIENHSTNEKESKAATISIKESIKDIATIVPYEFTTDPKEQAVLWKIRKETLPTVAGMRKSGTAAIIEDICVPVPMLSHAATDLRKVFADDGYDDVGIFGHALEGNLHFIFNQDFSTESEIRKYHKFMEDIASLIITKYDGSLKAEHGTGRNMAPFVEKEWGAKAYSLMKDVKKIFDPKGIINPGVLLNDNPNIHIQNLKPIPTTRPIVDKCMECGFCEGYCVSEGLTLSPRQRVAVIREIERLKATGEEPHRAAEMQKLFKYAGMATCATDSLCNLHCPVNADTGKLIKELRHEEHSAKGEKNAIWIEKRMGIITSLMRGGLKFINALRLLFGKKVFGALARGMRVITFKAIPLWNEHMPTGAKKIKVTNSPQKETNKVVYFPSCITRSMGTSKSYCNEKEITQLTEAILIKAGYSIVYPKNLNNLCCGMLFSSKGYVDAGQKASDELKAALIEASANGKYPILCDMSPCLYTMHTNMDEELKLYEPAEFIDKYIINKLNIKPIDKKVAIFAVCSAKKLGVENLLENIAKKCAKEVVVIDSNCCGFAGDRGFLFPELNSHGLRNLKIQASGCSAGYATSRTCEIGLSKNSGIQFNSILYLVAEAAGISTSK